MAVIKAKKKTVRKQQKGTIAPSRTFNVDLWIAKDPATPASVITGISPDMAARLLLRNTKNRPIAKTKLSVYSQNMIDDIFPLTSSAIAFDKDGALQNGQHRLQALVASGKTIVFLVAKGLEPMSFLYEDIHIKRSLSDMLAILKEPNYKVLASALSLLHRYFNAVKAVEGELKLREIPAEFDRRHRMHATLTINTVAAQIHEALSLLDDRPDVRESVGLYASRKLMLVSPGMLAALHYLGARIDRERTEQFLEAVMTGVSHDAEAPEAHLVRLLHNAAISRNTTMHTEGKFKYSLKALREALAGRPMKQLRLSPRVVRVTSDGERIVKAEEIPLLEDMIDGVDRTLPVEVIDDREPKPDDPGADEIKRKAKQIREGRDQLPLRD